MSQSENSFFGKLLLILSSHFEANEMNCLDACVISRKTEAGLNGVGLSRLRT